MFTMTKMFTRTITTFAAIAYEAKWDMDKGTGKLVEVGRCEYVAASTTPTEARAALKAAGVPVRKGMQVKIGKIAEQTYGMTVDEFMQHAHIIEKVEEVEA